MVGLFALTLIGCYSNSLNVSRQKLDANEFITTRNADKVINECDRLISIYKDELKKIGNKVDNTSDSGMVENKEIASIIKLNQKLDEKMNTLEDNLSSLTTEQVERFKVLQARYHFSITSTYFED